jgi:hypothetical protein
VIGTSFVKILPNYEKAATGMANREKIKMAAKHKFLLLKNVQLNVLF